MPHFARTPRPFSALPVDGIQEGDSGMEICRLEVNGEFFADAPRSVFL
jgi:hypothetical protein